ncbi:MAG: YncE family protein [Candidatus Marsarchaeota archaeon]|nr:YncE family protein [Candidatus Marsarchaeota archaeon]
MAREERERERERQNNLFGKKFYQKDKSNNRKAQSAMEYLMTYGWAILIIAVILAALDILGVFNGSAFISSSCLSTPGYLCSSPVMVANTNGPNLLSFSFKQDTGETLYNVSFMCAASSTSQGYPNVNVTSTNYGAQTSSNLTVLTSGSSVDVSGLKCYGSNGNLFKNNPIGAVFSGTLWIRYNLQGYPPYDYEYAKIAKITAKVESEAAISALPSSPTQLTFSSLSPPSPSIDAGQSVTLTVSWLGGVSPFTVNWFSGASAGSMSLLYSYNGIISSSLSNSITITTNAATPNTYYSANIIDSSTPPNIVSSSLDLVTVNPSLSTPSILSSSNSLQIGQSVTFSSSWAGGTAPYTARLYSSATSSCTSSSSLVQTQISSANSISFSAVTPTSTAYYCIYVTDSAYSPETTNSIVFLLPLVSTVSAGITNPRFIIYNPSNNFMYILNRGTATVSTNTVSVMSGNTIVNSITVGPDPAAGLYDPNNGDIYIANAGNVPAGGSIAGNTISVISGNTVASTITVGSCPINLAYDSANGYIYVSNYCADTVSVVNSASQSVVATITLSSTASSYIVTYNPNNTDIYASANCNPTVDIISGTALSTSFSTGGSVNCPQYPAYDPTNKYLYLPTGTAHSSNVSVISGSTVVNTITVGLNPTGALYDASNGYIYVTDSSSNAVSVIDPSTESVISTIPVGQQPTGVPVYDPSNGYIYVANYNSDTVSIINPSLNSVISTVNVGSGPSYITYDPSNKDMYVANYLSNNITIITN